jgi:hypothetical protein
MDGRVAMEKLLARQYTDRTKLGVIVGDDLMLF